MADFTSNFTLTGANGSVISQSSITTTGAFFGNGANLSGIMSTASANALYGQLGGTQTWSGGNTFIANITISTAVTLTSSMTIINSAASIAIVVRFSVLIMRGLSSMTGRATAAMAQARPTSRV